MFRIFSQNSLGCVVVDFIDTLTNRERNEKLSLNTAKMLCPRSQASRSGGVRGGQARSGHGMSGEIRQSQTRSDIVSLGQTRSGKVR